MIDLASTESLQKAGFPTSAAAQERFVAEVAARRMARMELPTTRAVLYGAGAALSALGAALLLARGDMTGVYAAGGSTTMHVLGALLAEQGRRRRAARDGDAHPSACFRDDDGKLRPRLAHGERELRAADADGKTRPLARRIAALTQIAWGVVLGGVPIAVAGGAALSQLGLVVVTLGTFLGTLVFGRGVMSLLATKPVERVALTSERVVLLGSEGMARSIALTSLRHRPVVVARAGGRATVALDATLLPATSPLPLSALVGLDDLEEASARAWAADAVDARRALLTPR